MKNTKSPSERTYLVPLANSIMNRLLQKSFTFTIFRSSFALQVSLYWSILYVAFQSVFHFFFISSLWTESIIYFFSVCRILVHWLVCFESTQEKNLTAFVVCWYFHYFTFAFIRLSELGSFLSNHVLWEIYECNGNIGHVRTLS